MLEEQQLVDVVLKHDVNIIRNFGSYFFGSGSR